MIVLVVAGWLTAFGLAGFALLVGWQAIDCAGDKDYPHARHSLIAASVLACAAVCLLAVLGGLPPLIGVAFGTIAAVTAIITVWYDTDQARNRGPAHVIADTRVAARMAVLDVGQRYRVRKSARDSGTRVVSITPETSPPGPVPPSGSGGGRRLIPPVREDPALAAPAPGDVGPGSIVTGDIPPDWAALCSRRADFESEDKDAFLAFFRGEAAGFLAYAEAMRACAEHHGEPGVGLDPACVQSVLEFADTAGQQAHGASLIRRRLLAVYGDIIDAVDAGLRIPKDARRWLGGGSGRGEAA